MNSTPQPAAVPVRGRRAGATVRLHPLLTGEFLAPLGFFKRPRGPLGFVRGFGLHVPRRQWRWCPIPAFLVEHPGAGALLIDTGVDASALRDPAQQFGSVLPRLSELRVRSGQDAVSQARERGVEPAAIGTVVLTHLHYDHAGAAGQLPHATFLFDGREWPPAVRGRLLEGYRRETVKRPVDWRMLDLTAAAAGVGFSQAIDLLGDGSVHVVSTPGHSPGHVSVVLHTALGPVLVAGGGRRLHSPRDHREPRSARARRRRRLPRLPRRDPEMGRRQPWRADHLQPRLRVLGRSARALRVEARHAVAPRLAPTLHAAMAIDNDRRDRADHPTP